MGQSATPTDPLEVLIVDDDKMVSFLHGKVLERTKIKTEPLFFGDGKTAFDYIEGHPQAGTSFLVFLDLNMPVMDGWEFLDKCKESDMMSRIFVIVVTSSVNKEDLYRALDYKQVLGFSNKPFTKESLQNLMEFPAIKELFIEMEYEAFENGTW